MSFTKRILPFVGLALLLAFMLSSATALGQSKAAKDAEEKSSEADPFVVPDGGPAEMLDYIVNLKKQRPDPREDRRAYIEFMIKSAKPILEAAEKVLDNKDATEVQKKKAAKDKFGALMILNQVGDKKAVKAMAGFIDQLDELGLTDLAQMAKSQVLSRELAMSVRGMPDAKPLDEVLGELKKLVAEQPDKGSFRLAYGAVSALQMVDKNQEAATLCDDFAKLYGEADSPDAKDLVEKFEAIGRRLRLVGHPMKVEGTLLDGDSFDWSAYKGKVVLVQFWATWCGYCVKEIPNIEECYKAYHDKGFDVVGISLDRKQDDLDKFLDKNELPWPVLYKEGDRNPTADYYGVTGLPTLILVGKDGNVISLNARGEKLNELLEKIYGPMKKADDKPAEL